MSMTGSAGAAPENAYDQEIRFYMKDASSSDDVFIINNADADRRSLHLL